MHNYFFLINIEEKKQITFPFIFIFLINKKQYSIKINRNM